MTCRPNRFRSKTPEVFTSFSHHHRCHPRQMNIRTLTITFIISPVVPLDLFVVTRTRTFLSVYFVNVNMSQWKHRQRSDVFSFGIVIWEILTRCVPPGSLDGKSLFEYHKGGGDTPPRRLASPRCTMTWQLLGVLVVSFQIFCMK
jgi:hypothetical protein